ncbi:MAG: patatin-like phospholipase family protein [Propionibacteriaceae bacterium]
MAFVGAIEVLTEAGYDFPRIAGTSAGAITGALLAALQQAGEPLSRLPDLAGTLDLSKVTDSGRMGRILGPLHGLADAASLLFEGGLYEGKYLRNWLTGVLADLGVHTFGDLRRVDPGSGLEPDREYALVVVASDLSSHRMSLLPWDFRHYGLDPDEQSVATAVCASAAMPFVFEPVRLRTPGGTVSLVDGGLLSNYPITIFDQPEPTEARWPTIGIRLSAREEDRGIAGPVDNAFELARALVQTALHGVDRRHVDDPATIARTMFIDTSEVPSLDFDLTAGQQGELVRSGRAAATKFFAEKGPDAARRDQ